MKQKILRLIVFGSFLLTSCLPGGQSNKGGRVITVYGFSIMKESMEKEIYPAFAAKWKAEHGEEVHFNSAFAGSETVTNQILQGAPADIAVLSIERDVERLIAACHVLNDWTTTPQKGIVNKTPLAFRRTAAARRHCPRACLRAGSFIV